MTKRFWRTVAAALCLVMLLPTLSASADDADTGDDTPLAAADAPTVFFLDDASTSSLGTASAAGATIAVETQGIGNNYQLVDTSNGYPTGSANSCTGGYDALFPDGEVTSDQVFDTLDRLMLADDRFAAAAPSVRG